MANLNTITLEALDRYFNVVTKTGYVNNSSVSNLLLLIFLQEFIKNYQYYITEDDYRTISRLLVCLEGNSCLVPYREYKQSTPTKESYLLNLPVRITQIDDLRTTLNNNVRL